MVRRKKQCCKKKKRQKGGFISWMTYGHPASKKYRSKQKGGSAQWTYPTAKHGWRGWGSYWHPDPNAMMQRGGTSIQPRNGKNWNWFFQRGGTAFPIKEYNYRVGENNWFFKYRK